MDKGRWTSCRSPGQRGYIKEEKKKVVGNSQRANSEDKYASEREREREGAHMDYSSHRQKVGQRKTVKHSLALQHANMHLWQWAETVENTKEVVGRWKDFCSICVLEPRPGVQFSCMLAHRPSTYRNEEEHHAAQGEATGVSQVSYKTNTSLALRSSDAKSENVHKSTQGVFPPTLCS